MPREAMSARLVLLWLLAVVVVLTNRPANAQSGVTHRVAGAGVNMAVDTHWLDGAGYRPIRITVTPTAPVTADRTLSFEFVAWKQWRNSRSDLRVVQDIELPAGTGPVTATLSVPHMTGYQRYEFRVAEGGRWLRGLAGQGAFQNQVMDDRLPRVLLVAGKPPPNSAGLARIFVSDGSRRNQYSYNYGYGQPQATTQLSSLAFSTLQTERPQDLPSRWVDYSAVDILCISMGDLTAMKSAQAETFDAIRRWAAAGGNLLVFGIGTEWERLAELESLLEFGPASSSDGSPRPGWREPRRSQYSQPVSGLGNDLLGPFEELAEVAEEEYAVFGNGTYQQPKPKPKKSDTKKPKPDQTPPGKAPFASRPFEMGMVVAIATDNPFDEGPAYWAWMVNHVTSRRATWFQRHGMSQLQDNLDFYRFLVKGVGRAPLNAFRILISLFVIAIGPINYFLLRRARRLHLLIVTVPVSAGAVTLALFAYALISDGLGTRVRVRSVTCVNQATGQTECWARLSYYSGLAPGGGLRFSDDVAVHPYIAFTGERTSATRELIWHDGQRLTSGWLRSRTPTQFLTVRSRTSNLRLKVGEAAGEELPIRNELKCRIKKLLVRGADGKHYVANDVAQGAQVVAQPADPATEVAKIRELIGECDLSFPPGVDASNLAYQFRRQRGWWSPGNTGIEPAMRTGLLESAIAETTSSVRPVVGAVQKRTYVAIVEINPEVQLGTDRAKQEDSLHVIVGSW